MWNHALFLNAISISRKLIYTHFCPASVANISCLLSDDKSKTWEMPPKGNISLFTVKLVAQWTMVVLKIQGIRPAVFVPKKKKKKQPTKILYNLSGEFQMRAWLSWLWTEAINRLTSRCNLSSNCPDLTAFSAEAFSAGSCVWNATFCKLWLCKRGVKYRIPLFLKRMELWPVFP